MGIKFDKNSLAVEQNSYLTEIINFYIVYNLDAWPKNLTNNFSFTNCLFGATSVVKNSDERKWIYSGYGTTWNRFIEFQK